MTKEELIIKNTALEKQVNDYRKQMKFYEQFGEEKEIVMHLDALSYIISKLTWVEPKIVTTRLDECMETFIKSFK